MPVFYIAAMTITTMLFNYSSFSSYAVERIYCSISFSLNRYFYPLFLTVCLLQCACTYRLS